MCSMVTFTPACLPNSAACWSLITSAAGTKLLHSRTCNVLVWAKAGACPVTNSAPAAAARAILVLRKARRVSPPAGLPPACCGTLCGIRLLLHAAAPPQGALSLLPSRHDRISQSSFLLSSKPWEESREGKLAPHCL